MSPAAVRDMALIPVDEAPQIEIPPAANLALVIERLAANPSVDVAKLEKIIELQERVLASQAKSAFAAAFSKMQGELPPIENRKKTNTGKYAPLEDIVEVVRPILSKWGFALSHRCEWPPTTPPKIRVIGILTHEAGHERESIFEAEADESGSKNDIQGLGSSNAYGRRYTTKDLLGVVTRNEDTDGARSQVRQEIKAPHGFYEWFGDLQAVADNGHAALKDAWTKSKPEFREHLTKTNSQGWEALKRRAAGVKA